MPAVLAAIKSLSRKYIRFPYNDAQQSVIKRQFYEIAGFPNVVGVIDCTHVRLKAPSMNDYAFINRKNYHSINVQVICDAKLSLLNVVASCVGAQLQEGALQSQSHLLSKWLPSINCPTVCTHAHGSQSSCFGLLKGRWLRLEPAGGTLLYTLEKVCDIILACSVLHNIALVNGGPFDVPTQPDEPMPMEPWPAQPPLVNIRRRQDLIHRL
uniref:Putative nuclease HARBI1 n=1 Tax=Sparus aurata TaxID=8175 RepID=A0A671Y2E2_SPAAU